MSVVSPLDEASLLDPWLVELLVAVLVSLDVEPTGDVELSLDDEASVTPLGPAVVPACDVFELGAVAVWFASELALELPFDRAPVDVEDADVVVAEVVLVLPASERVSVSSVPSSIVIVHAVAPSNATQMAFIQSSVKPNAALVKHTHPRVPVGEEKLT